MNAIVYTRFSPRPAKDGDAELAAANEDAESIQLQIDVCERYAIMKSLVITETIKDRETSARKTPVFQREGGQGPPRSAPGSAGQFDHRVIVADLYLVGVGVAEGRS